MRMGEYFLLVEHIIIIGIAVINILARFVHLGRLGNPLFLASAEFIQPNTGKGLGLIDAGRLRTFAVVPSLIKQA